MNAVDQAVLELMQSIQHPVLDELMLIITHAVSYPVLLLVLILLIYMKKEKMSIKMFIGLLIEATVIIAIKNITARPRPTPRGLNPKAAFPSGHSSRSTYLALLFSEKWNKKIIWFSLAALVMFSRLYLQVHHLTDIIGGIAVGSLVYWLVSKYELDTRIQEKIKDYRKN